MSEILAYLPIRFLHQQLSAATLRKDHEGQAVLINCLMRNYLHYSHYDQAHKLIVKIEFPQQVRGGEILLSV